MNIDPEYEVKFHLYDGNEQELEPHIKEFEKFRLSHREEGSVMSKVLSYFFEGTVELIKGDQFLWDNQYKKAYDHYNSADRMLNRFKNSRNVEVRIDYLNNRLVHRTIGLRSMSEGLQMSDTAIKIDKFSDALTNFNKEVEICNLMEETMSSYAAFARASFAESQFLLYSAQNEREHDSGNAKRMLMQARSAIRQAAFIDPRFLDYLYDIEDNLDDLTKNRILIKAEGLGDKATIKSENGNYMDAKDDFRRASLFYKRASSLAADTSSRRYLLSSATIYEASELEAEGNHLFRRENETAKASEKYQEAAQYVDKAIALMGRFGSKSLEDSFGSQRDYYKAMGLQTGAINLFDQEMYLEAKAMFEQSLQLFDQAKKAAISGENEVLVALSEEAKGDIKGYLTMCDAMI